MSSGNSFILGSTGQKSRSRVTKTLSEWVFALMWVLAFCNLIFCAAYIFCKYWTARWQRLVFGVRQSFWFDCVLRRRTDEAAACDGSATSWRSTSHQRRCRGCTQETPTIVNTAERLSPGDGNRHCRLPCWTSAVSLKHAGLRLVGRKFHLNLQHALTFCTFLSVAGSVLTRAVVPSSYLNHTDTTRRRAVDPVVQWFKEKKCWQKHWIRYDIRWGNISRALNSNLIYCMETGKGKNKRKN